MLSLLRSIFLQNSGYGKKRKKITPPTLWIPTSTQISMIWLLHEKPGYIYVLDVPLNLQFILVYNLQILLILFCNFTNPKLKSIVYKFLSHRFSMFLMQPQLLNYLFNLFNLCSQGWQDTLVKCQYLRQELFPTLNATWKIRKCETFLCLDHTPMVPTRTQLPSFALTKRTGFFFRKRLSIEEN